MERELYEELGAIAGVMDTAFVLKHEKAGKQLEEHFFVCLLRHYDLSQALWTGISTIRHGESIFLSSIPLDAAELRRDQYQDTPNCASG